MAMNFKLFRTVLLVNIITNAPEYKTHNVSQERKFKNFNLEQLGEAVFTVAIAIGMTVTFPRIIWKTNRR